MQRGHPDSTAPARVAVLAYDGCFAAEIFGLTDVLTIANRVARARGLPHDLFETAVIAPGGGTVTAAGGFRIDTEPPPRAVATIVVPGFDFVPDDDLDLRLAATRAQVGVVERLAGRGAEVASVCIGAFLLGDAGVLDHRRATTSWLFAAQLARRFPTTTVTADAMIVTDGPVTTTAAFSAVHDLAMDLVRRHGGEAVARTTARITLIPGNRTSQAPHVDRATLAAMRVGSATGSFSDDVSRRLAERLADPYDLGALASAFGVSTRTLLRRFATERGQSPLEHLQDLRVEAAKRLLERSDEPVDRVTERVGYHDPGTFRRLFVRRVGVTPATYRRQFHSP